MSYEPDDTKATRIDTNNTDNIDGEVINLVIDGETVSYRLEDGITDEERNEFINSMLGIESPEVSPEVDHPELEFAENPAEVEDELEGFRTLCRHDDCHQTEVFTSMLDIKGSDWTDVEYGGGILSDKTDLAYACCPEHSLTEEEGYIPETDSGSMEHFSTELLEKHADEEVIPTEIGPSDYDESEDDNEYPVDIHELHDLMESLADELWEYRYGDFDIPENEAVETYQMLTGVLHQYRQFHAEEWVVTLQEDTASVRVVDDVFSIKGLEYSARNYPFVFPADQTELVREAVELGRELEHKMTTKSRIKESAIPQYQRLAGILATLEEEHNEELWVIFEKEGPVFILNGERLGSSEEIANLKRGNYLK